MNTTGEQHFSIVAVDSFIQATRDSGYKGTSSAIAELIDNSLQAGATSITVSLTVDLEEDERLIILTVIDNGSGMDSQTLRTALRFGGSTRFNDRGGLGRYGMGLPNSSLSQAKASHRAHLEFEARSGAYFLSRPRGDRGRELTEVPKPTWVKRPEFVNGYDSGTVVTWSRCDRLDNKRISTITRKLLGALGRQFRHFLWSGVSIKVNGDAVQPIDPALPPPRRALQRRDSIRGGSGLRGGRQLRRPQHGRDRQGAVLGTACRRVVEAQQRGKTSPRDR